MAIFVNLNGNQTYTGINGEYNQVDYTGSLSDFRIFRNADGSVTVEHPTLGTDTLNGIDGFWFGDEASWYSIDDAIAQTPGTNAGGGVTLQNGIFTGDASDNIINGTTQNDLFYGGRGDDVIDGGGGVYNQGQYDGALSDYIFTRNNNGSVTVDHPIWGTDTLTDIDGIWFIDEARWYSIADAIAASGGGEPSVNEGAFWLALMTMTRCAIQRQLMHFMAVRVTIHLLGVLVIIAKPNMTGALQITSLRKMTMVPYGSLAMNTALIRSPILTAFGLGGKRVGLRLRI